MAHKRMLYKLPEVDLRTKYNKWVEVAIIIALVFTTILFYGFQKFENATKLNKTVDTSFEATIIPPTQQLKKPPQPERPKIPVEADEDDDIPEDMEIDEAMFEFDTIADDMPPPPEEEEPIVPFYALSKKPVEIQRIQPVYPELAKKAGVEGKVVVKVLVDTNGEVEDAKMVKSNPLLDEAALTAARQYKFTPAMQRDKKVKVWVSISFNFRLTN